MDSNFGTVIMALEFNNTSDIEAEFFGGAEGCGAGGGCSGGSGGSGGTAIELDEQTNINNHYSTPFLGEIISEQLTTMVPFP